MLGVGLCKSRLWRLIPQVLRDQQIRFLGILSLGIVSILGFYLMVSLNVSLGFYLVLGFLEYDLVTLLDLLSDGLLKPLNLLRGALLGQATVVRLLELLGNVLVEHILTRDDLVRSLMNVFFEDTHSKVTDVLSDIGNSLSGSHDILTKSCEML